MATQSIQTTNKHQAARVAAFVYGIVCYVIFLSTPTMSVAHLVFAVVTAAYILFAIQLEERDLIEVHGKAYVDYRDRVPMLIPFRRHKTQSKRL